MDRRFLIFAALSCTALACSAPPRPDVEQIDVPPPMDTFDAAPETSMTEDVITSDASEEASLADVPEAGIDAIVAPDAACGAAVQMHDMQPGAHVEETVMITYSTNPPSSGDHFAAWARWGIYRTAIPRGHWVHNLEHGAVVISYRCDGDCTATRNRLEALAHRLPPEPACTGMGTRRRLIIVPDPLLEAPVAASAWGWTYKSNCVDEISLESFVLNLTGHAPEDFCNEGFYPPDDAGTGPIPL